ncbi:unnamed protein product [Clonostachys rhizophaga]|uniref:Uncharacterized protein n=1 Tax=Clonostachys rhizophaga TaxID=160324 RepID=A0A9N9YHW2_9HYPO|nr:unnamed protein product [Clonostachys rhizophaga]
MPSPLSPVTACALKELEIIGGHSSRVYNSTQLANALTLTLEGQHTSPREKPVLCLLVNSGSRCILSIRLSDLLPTKPPFSQAISTKVDTQQLRVDVQEQEHAVVTTFEHRREFNLAVYMLQEYGFSIKEAALETTEVGDDCSQTSTLAFESPADFGPRLSSFTTFPGMMSGASLAAQPELPWETHVGSMIPDTHPEVLSNGHLSIPNQLLQTRQNSCPSSFSNTPHLHQTSYMSQLNPYNVFLGKQAFSDYRPKVSSPLRKTLSHNEPLQVIPPRSSQNPVNLPPSPTPIAPFEVGDLSPQPDLCSNDRLAISSQSPVLPRRFPSSPISVYRQMSDSSTELSSPNLHHFRELMPPTRSLPFDHSQKDGPRRFTDDQDPVTREQPSNSNSPKVQGKRKRKPKAAEPMKHTSSGSPKKPAKGRNLPRITATGSSQDHTTIKASPAAIASISSHQGHSSKAKMQKAHPLSPSAKINNKISAESKKDATHINSTSKSKRKPENKAKPRSRASIKGQLPNTPGDSLPSEVTSPTDANPEFPSNTQATSLKEKGDDNAPLKARSLSSSSDRPDIVDSQPQRKSSRLAKKARSLKNSSAKDSPPECTASEAEQEVRPELPVPETHLSSETVLQEQEPAPPELQPTAQSNCSVANNELTILVTDEMLRQVNEMTSELFDQFEADLKGGKNDAALAEYYLGQIVEIRKGFWHSEIAKLSHGEFQAC